MGDAFACGHSRTPDNTEYHYGNSRCLTCKRRQSRESARKRRAAWKAKHGAWNAVPENDMNQAA